MRQLVSLPNRRSCWIASATLIIAIANAATASAQMTTCMTHEGGLTQCNTVGTPEHDHRSYDDSDSGAALGAAILAMKERSLRAKLGKMVANGDCQGASDYALQKGRFEWAAELRRSCQP